jgi:Ion transport protein
MSSVNTTTTTMTTSHSHDDFDKLRQRHQSHHLASHAASLARVDPVSAESVRKSCSAARFTLDNSFALDPMLPRQFPQAKLNNNYESKTGLGPDPKLNTPTTATTRPELQAVHDTNRFLYVTTSDNVLRRYTWDNLEKNGAATVADSSASGVLDALAAGDDTVSEDDLVQMIFNQEVQRAEIQVAPRSAQAHTMNAHVCVTSAETALRDCEPLPEHIRKRIEQRYEHFSEEFPRYYKLLPTVAGRFHSAIVLGGRYGSEDSWLSNPVLSEAKESKSSHQGPDEDVSESPAAPRYSHYLRCEAELPEHECLRRDDPALRATKVCTWYYANKEDKFQDALQIVIFEKHLIAVFKHGITILFEALVLKKSFGPRIRLHIPADPDSKFAKYLTRNAIVTYDSHVLSLRKRGYSGHCERGGFVIVTKLNYGRETGTVESMGEDPALERYTPPTREAICNTLPYKMEIDIHSKRQYTSMVEHEQVCKPVMSATDISVHPNRVVMEASDESLGVDGYSTYRPRGYTNMTVSSNDEVMCIWEIGSSNHTLLVYKLREQLRRAFMNAQLCVPSIRPNINAYHIYRHSTTLQSASFSDDSERVAVLYENSEHESGISTYFGRRTVLSLALAVYGMSGEIIADVSSLLKDMYNPDDTATGSVAQMIVKFAPGSTNILVCLLHQYICAIDTDAARVIWRHCHNTSKKSFYKFDDIWVTDSQASCVIIQDRSFQHALPIMFTRLYKHTGSDDEEDVVAANPLKYDNDNNNGYAQKLELLAVSLHPAATGSNDQFTLQVLLRVQDGIGFQQSADLRFAALEVDRRRIRQQHAEDEAKLREDAQLPKHSRVYESSRDRDDWLTLLLQPYTFPSDTERCVAFGLPGARFVTCSGSVIDLHTLRQVSAIGAEAAVYGVTSLSNTCMIDRGRGERAFLPSGKCVDLRTGEVMWDNKSITERYGKIAAASPDGTWVLRASEYRKGRGFSTVSTVCPLLCDGHTGLPYRRLIDKDDIQYKYLTLDASKAPKHNDFELRFGQPTDKEVDEIQSLLLQALEAAHSPAEPKPDHDSKSDAATADAGDAKHNTDDVKLVAKCYATYALLFHACYRGDTKVAMACVELGGLNPLWTPPAGTTQNGQRAHALAIAIAFKHGSLVLRLVTHISSADRIHPRRLAPIMRVFDFADIRSRHAVDSTWSKQRLAPVPDKEPAAESDAATTAESDVLEKFWAKAVTSLRPAERPLSCFEVLADKYPGALMSLLEHTSSVELSHPRMQPSALRREPLLLVPLPLFKAPGATLSADSQQPQLVRAHMRTLDYYAEDTSSANSIWHQDIEVMKENAPDPDSVVTVRARHVVSGLPLTGWNQPSRPLFGGRSAGVPDPHTTDTTGLISAREYLEHHPLDALLKAGLKSAFGTECVRRAVDYKWTAFARQVYLQRMASYLLFLLCYVLATVQFGFEPYSSIWDSGEFTDASGQDVIHSQWVWSCVRVLLEAVVLAFGVHYALVEYHQFRREPSAKAYLTDPWNILDVSSCILIAVLVPLHIADSTQRFPVQSVLSVLLWVKSLHYARGFFSTGPFIRMLVEIGAGTTSFMLILVVVLCGFAQAFLLVFHSPDSANAFASDYASWTVLLRVYQLMLGDADMDEIRAADFPGMAVALFVAFTLIVVILMLNLLIALMSSIFERVHENVEAEWYLERTEIILELERSHIQQYIDDTSSDSNAAELLPSPESAAARSVSPSDNPYLPYLHVLQMVDESEEVQKPAVPVTREEFLDRTSSMMEDLSQSAGDMDAALNEKLQQMQQQMQQSQSQQFQQMQQSQNALNQKLQLLLDEFKRNDTQTDSVSQSDSA